MNGEAKTFLTWLAVIGALLLGSLFFKGIGEGRFGGIIITGVLLACCVGIIAFISRKRT